METQMIKQTKGNLKNTVIKTILAVVIMTLGSVMTSTIAFADSDGKVNKYKAQQKMVKNKKTFFCKSGYKMRWKNKTAWCLKSGSSNQSVSQKKNKNLSCKKGQLVYVNKQGLNKCFKRNPGKGWNIEQGSAWNIEQGSAVK